ncbi:NAD(P)/FAD-dependent oxidoreductase [Mucilaginibacter sp. SG564]|uniref:FAD-dependent oxidoreductase n=1 Tax=Mucilaginibacter sp. SG564 TaxID=2587022 RepID=UPI001554B42B|nr:NAD(P)/FAD-dependent oxidoreductase [Mucilaginibacter sp. SG564]NOW96447.1 2-polyprenyl-6-methoxyphenol hydroxylase-like FAD-dependent oxidoreductase [Mucilaginibacter sp. SG564]
MIQTPELLLHKNIAIVGGGPGGLTLARLLQQQGAQVKVYERDHSQAARVQGAIVDLHFDSGLKAMEATGLMEAFKANYMAGADKYRLLDPKGNILLDEGNQVGEPQFGNPHFRPEIDRGALRDLLIDGLLPGTVIWDSQFVSMKGVDHQWELQFKNGTTATADIVIGSDGYRSLVRPYLTNVKALYSGATIIQGEIDHPETACPEFYQLVNQANLMAMGNGATIAAQPRGDGGLTFYAASLLPENWVKTSGIDFSNPQDVQDYLINHYEGWNPIFFTLFKACTHFVPRPLNYFPLENRWEAKNNITLIGDAAHLMPPNGEGVNLAMLDALDLSDCLTDINLNNLIDAIAAYEKIMFDRAAPLCKETIDGISDFAAPTEESVLDLIKMLS